MQYSIWNGHISSDIRSLFFASRWPQDKLLTNLLGVRRCRVQKQWSWGNPRKSPDARERADKVQLPAVPTGTRMRAEVQRLRLQSGRLPLLVSVFFSSSFFLSFSLCHRSRALCLPNAPYRNVELSQLETGVHLSEGGRLLHIRPERAAGVPQLYGTMEVRDERQVRFCALSTKMLLS